MRFYDPEQISRGVQAHYLGPSPVVREHAETAALWADDEPVPSRFHVIGKLTVNPKLLAQVNRSLAEEGEFLAYPAQGGFGEELKYSSVEPPSPFLNYFFTTCARRFEGLVQQDLERTLDLAKRRMTYTLIAGPYEAIPKDDWHRDALNFRNLTYRAAMTGPAIEFATGSYRSSDFDDHFLKSKPLPQNVQLCEVGDVIVHDATSALSREPTLRFNGYMRISGDIVVHNIFN